MIARKIAASFSAWAISGRQGLPARSASSSRQIDTSPTSSLRLVRNASQNASTQASWASFATRR